MPLEQKLAKSGGVLLLVQRTVPASAATVVLRSGWRTSLSARPARLCRLRLPGRSGCKRSEQHQGLCTWVVDDPPKWTSRRVCRCCYCSQATPGFKEREIRPEDIRLRHAETSATPIEPTNRGAGEAGNDYAALLGRLELELAEAPSFAAWSKSLEVLIDCPSTARSKV